MFQSFAIKELDWPIRLDEACILMAFQSHLEYTTMSHELPCGVGFWSFLLSIDQDLAGKRSTAGLPMWRSTSLRQLPPEAARRS